LPDSLLQESLLHIVPAEKETAGADVCRRVFGLRITQLAAMSEKSLIGFPWIIESLLPKVDAALSQLGPPPDMRSVTLGARLKLCLFIE
jgi:hypothetical protein